MLVLPCPHICLEHSQFRPCLPFIVQPCFLEGGRQKRKLLLPFQFLLVTDSSLAAVTLDFFRESMPPPLCLSTSLHLFQNRKGNRLLCSLSTRSKRNVSKSHVLLLKYYMYEKCVNHAHSSWVCGYEKICTVVIDDLHQLRS